MFSKSSTKRSAERLFEERLYEQVVTELSRGEKRQGLWAKAIADAEGIDEKAKSFYIKYRVQSLKDEWSLAEHEKAQKEENNKRKELQALRERNAILRKNSRNKFKNEMLGFAAFFTAIVSLLLTIVGATAIPEQGLFAVCMVVFFGAITYKLWRFAFSKDTGSL
ncbi:hypothetical protein BM524_08210 [Alteromonas mediterranea]|uniref:Uncharacterized protein n=1 Tax=Alteromonas mediterranea TaxID=314275 RepID=A0AAC9J9W6_9ALTE|nr:hypothetical protein [Alteromonas mediterranea]APD89769.1 hypothetical protein BM524_08210 [Alteromonas mediterranea]